MGVRSLNECLAVFAFAMAVIVAGAPGANAAVDLELSLLVDTSSSINSNEFSVQMAGYSAAFRHSGLIDDILHGGPNGAIAVNMVHFARGAIEVIPWRVLASEAGIAQFADDIDALLRQINGQTGIVNALNFAHPLFASNGIESDRQVIDISGDGTENVQAQVLSLAAAAAVEAARDAALAAGIDVINGLAMPSNYVGEDVESFYGDHVIGGVDAFLIFLEDGFEGFEVAVLEKLGIEIGGDPVIPEPASVVIWSLLGGLGIAVAWRRRRK